ncbi:MAG: PQQ-binding-like beta-propeller repeat protein [Planctomycetaceae bacterium]
MIMRICCHVIAVLCCVTSLNAADWPQFRGVDSQGVSQATGLPLTWDDASNLRWKAKLPGAGASSPILLNDQLYVTCYSGYGQGTSSSGELKDLRLHLLAVSHAEGSIVFDRVIEPTFPETERVRDHGYAAATPATDGDAIYVFFGKSGVMRFTPDGEFVWRTSVGDGTHEWGCGTSPVLFEDLVIVNASVESGDLVALNKQSGKEVWRAGGMKASWNTPHLVTLPDGRRELVVSVRDDILAFDPATGKSLWQCQGIPDYVCPSIVSKDGIVYVIGGRQSRAMAIRAGGRGNVTDSHLLWSANAGANVCSPVIHGDHLYWVSDRNSVAYCVALATGEVVYQERFPDQPYASALAADGKLYIVTREGGTYVLAASPEYRQLAHNRFADRSTFNASPIVAGNDLILRSDSYLYCIGSDD